LRCRWRGIDSRAFARGGGRPRCAKWRVVRASPPAGSVPPEGTREFRRPYRITSGQRGNVVAPVHACRGDPIGWITSRGAGTDGEMDAMRKRSQQAAYGAYVRLYWRWARLPSNDPARPALAEATRRAEERWRVAMRPTSDTVLGATGCPVAASPLSSGAAARARTELHLPLYNSVSLTVWGD